MTSVIDFFQQSNLAFAAYADLTSGAIDPQKLRDVDMSTPQAQRFSQQWRVVDQFADSPSGASATIFEEVSSGQKYLAIRGTQPEVGDIVSDVILAVGVSGKLNPQFTALKDHLDNVWLTGGGLLHGEAFTVTGHSLGGYLAEAVKEQYSNQVTAAYLFNAPGSGGLVGNIADLVSGVFGQTVPGANGVWNIKASEGASIIAGLGSQSSATIPVQIEAAPGAGFVNHSIVRLTDALAVQVLYATLDPSLDQAQLSALVDASGNPMNLTLETALDVLRKLLLGASSAPTPADDRDAFYTHLYALQDDPTYTNLAAAGAQLTVLAGRAKADIASLAQQDSAVGLATRYALKELNPFALVGVDYSTFNTDGALDLYDPATGTGTLTTDYLADRADFLERKLWFSSEDKNPVDPNYVFNSTSNEFQNDDTYFKDFASGYQIAQGFAPATPHANIQRYLFGDAQANSLTGGGIDILNGEGGNDYLWGGTGDDQLLRLRDTRKSRHPKGTSSGARWRDGERRLRAANEAAFEMRRLG